jgi:hypothetical protein
MINMGLLSLHQNHNKICSKIWIQLNFKAKTNQIQINVIKYINQINKITKTWQKINNPPLRLVEAQHLEEKISTKLNNSDQSPLEMIS